MFSIFAIAAPGLEQVVGDELLRLGIRANVVQGGAAWEGPYRDVLDANLHLRVATRVLVRATTFRARTFHELERHAARVPWDRFAAPPGRVRLRVTCRKSKLYHEGAVAARLLDAIETVTGIRGEADSDAADDGDDQTGQLFVVRMLRDVCTISADSSGGLLHRRGYREAIARAPLRETLAAAMLLTSGWDARSPLLDPFCGSGTIPIEAALIARRIAPGLSSGDRQPRRFGFEQWPVHDPAAWSECVEQATGTIRKEMSSVLFASDRDPGAVRAALANAERAGVSDHIEFQTRAFAAVSPPADHGWIVTNPPYGVRIGRRADADRIIDQVIDRAKTDFGAWSVAMLTASAGHRGSPSRRSDSSRRLPARGLETRNGGIPVVLSILDGSGAWPVFPAAGALSIES